MRKNLFFWAIALTSSLFIAGCSDEEAQGESAQNEKVYFLMSPRSLTRTSTEKTMKRNLSQEMPSAFSLTSE